MTLMVVCEISVKSLMMYVGHQSVQQSLKIKTQETPTDNVGYITNVYDENCSLLLVILNDLATDSRVKMSRIAIFMVVMLSFMALILQANGEYVFYDLSKCWTGMHVDEVAH